MQPSAPPEYWTTSPEALSEIVNGCGPGGWKGMLVPDNLLGLDITKLCDIHDFRYYFGGSEADRKIADREFLNNMLDAVEADDEDFFLMEARRELAFTYYRAVRNHGKGYFNYAAV